MTPEGGPTMATNVSEKEARDVVEAAREAEWKLASFGKQLFLGDFQLDLIHPQPQLDPEQIEKGERFLAELQAVLAETADPLEIEREAKIPDRVVDALKRIGARDEGPPEVRWPRPVAVVLQQGAGDRRQLSRVGLHPAQCAPVDRRRR